MEFLYNLIVGPIYFIIEFLFDCFYDYNNNILLSIFLISLAVSLFCLPLYLKADNLQKEELEIQKKLSKKIKDIKKNFKGDERFFLLQTYYKQNNYHPIMGLRLSLSLLLQIPFFIAAYAFFSHLQLFNETSCLFIKNLAQPDGLIKIFNLKINILPILMTIINILAGIVYSKSLKENKGLIIMSLIFLILLYNSPSGLVLYWIFNNIFSLIKNIILKFTQDKNIKFPQFNLPNNLFSFNDKTIFILNVLVFWLILGVLIPSSTIANSPMEFIFKDATPMEIIQYSATIYAGLFLFWGSFLYYFSNNKLRKIFALILTICFYLSLFSMSIYNPATLILSNIFTFETMSPTFFVNNTVTICTIGITLIILSLYSANCIKTKVVKISKIPYILVIFICLCLSTYYYSDISTRVHNYFKSEKQLNTTNEKTYVNLSKNKKNVLIIFADRAISSYLPMIFNEHQELIEQYKGFTYYPNTFSYARYTILGYLPILGGYEYTPFALNENKKIFEEKYMESISVLPSIFSKNNWNSVIVNPLSDSWDKVRLSTKEIETMAKINSNIYKENNIKTKKMPDSIADNFATKTEIINASLSKRNSIYYSLLQVILPIFRTFLYDFNTYHNLNEQLRYHYTPNFIKHYAELYHLKDLTDFSSNENNFIVLNTNLTHNPALLKYPNYDIESKNDESYDCPLKDSNNYFSQKHYHVNVATIRFLGNYFDYLRKNNVYNNTRIIIISDHGMGHNLQAPLMQEHTQKLLVPYNPLFMVKDFDSKENIKISNDLMTNADVPIIATKNIIKNPINPFTNKKLSNNDKEHGILIKDDYDWQPYHYLQKTNFLKNNDKFIFIKQTANHSNYWYIKDNINYKEALELYKNERK